MNIDYTARFLLKTFDPRTLKIARLPSVLLASKKQLPTFPGVYFAVAKNSDVLYIGKAQNLRHRWVRHHRFDELVEAGCCSIAFMGCPLIYLSKVEAVLIYWFRPKLNKKLPSGRELEYRRRSDAGEVSSPYPWAVFHKSSVHATYIETAVAKLERLNRPL